MRGLLAVTYADHSSGGCKWASKLFGMAEIVGL